MRVGFSGVKSGFLLMRNDLLNLEEIRGFLIGSQGARAFLVNFSGIFLLNFFLVPLSRSF